MNNPSIAVKNSDISDFCNNDFCNYYDYEEPRIYNCKLVKAKKKYFCGECEMVIDIGDFYWGRWCLYSDGWYNFKRCQCCENICKNLNVCEYGMLREIIEEYYGFNYTDKVE